jgi:nucleoside 2-deoxyribosyltransferase
MTVSKLIYIAGPLFCQSEREHNEKIAALCEAQGFRTFLPHRDAGLQDASNAEAIYAEDLRNLEQADLIIANLDGADVDAGTAWEIGYAVARGKTALGLRIDRRCLEPWARVNLMIESSAYIVESFSDLEATLRALGGTGADSFRSADHS